MRRLLVMVGILVGATGLTTFGIDAADTWRGGGGGTMLAQLIGTKSLCPADMVEVPTGTTFSCVDKYEVAASAGCIYPNPKSYDETLQNIADKKCLPEIMDGAVPWRYVARADAERLCARVDKRLPTAQEWYRAALDTPVAGCMVAQSGVGASGSHSDCQSAVGAFDMVGNAWEWVSDDVESGQYRGRPLPPTGYVEQADASGIATKTNTQPLTGPYGTAYFWARSDGVYGMIRGGFYGSKGDAGVYAVHAHTPAEFTGEAIGFRCVR